MIDPANPDLTNTPVSAQRIRFGYAPLDATARPALSIVTPFFNTGAIFHETAQSVMQQSLQQFEWIIVNDGSTDPEALAILDSYRHLDPRLRVIDLPANSGASAAHNAGVAAAQTDFIVHLDSDDLMEPTTVEKWLWFLTSYPEYGAVTSYIVHFAARSWLRLNGFEIGREILEDNLVGMRSMVRRHVHDAAGGFNEANRQGLIDWEYWLRVAHAGYWGGTVPELLPWYRRRLGHGKQWPNWRPEGRKVFVERMHKEHAQLWQKGGFPAIQLRPHLPYAGAPDDLPCANLLRRDSSRLLVIGGGNPDMDALQYDGLEEWQITLAITEAIDNSALARYARHTPDVFVLPNIVRLVDYPRFLRYLIASRQADVVMLSGSTAGYLLLPYLRAWFPELPIIDFCGDTGTEMVARLSLAYHGLLDHTAVAAPDLAQFLAQQRAGATQPAMPSATPVSQEAGRAAAIQAIEYLRLAEQARPSVPLHSPARTERHAAAAPAGAGKRRTFLSIKAVIKRVMRRT